jgi:hypothetical protein
MVGLAIIGTSGDQTIAISDFFNSRPKDPWNERVDVAVVMLITS